jgi:hypothetical protein
MGKNKIMEMACEDTSYLEEILPFEPISKKDMICITKERYEELLECERFYIEMCDL